MDNHSVSGRLKTVLIGKSRDLSEKGIFHKLSLIAFFIIAPVAGSKRYCQTSSLAKVKVSRSNWNERAL